MRPHGREVAPNQVGPDVRFPVADERPPVVLCRRIAHDELERHPSGLGDFFGEPSRRFVGDQEDRRPREEEPTEYSLSSTVGPE